MTRGRGQGSKNLFTEMCEVEILMLISRGMVNPKYTLARHGKKKRTFLDSLPKTKLTQTDVEKLKRFSHEAMPVARIKEYMVSTGIKNKKNPEKPITARESKVEAIVNSLLSKKGSVLKEIKVVKPNGEPNTYYKLVRLKDDYISFLKILDIMDEEKRLEEWFKTDYVKSNNHNIKEYFFNTFKEDYEYLDELIASEPEFQKILKQHPDSKLQMLITLLEEASRKDRTRPELLELKPKDFDKEFDLWSSPTLMSMINNTNPTQLEDVSDVICKELGISLITVFKQIALVDKIKDSIFHTPEGESGEDKAERLRPLLNAQLNLSIEMEKSLVDRRKLINNEEELFTPLHSKILKK